MPKQGFARNHHRVIGAAQPRAVYTVAMSQTGPIIRVQSVSPPLKVNKFLDTVDCPIAAGMHLLIHGLLHDENVCFGLQYPLYGVY